jgi:hypothetical protein
VNETKREREQATAVFFNVSREPAFQASATDLDLLGDFEGLLDGRGHVIKVDRVMRAAPQNPYGTGPKVRSGSTLDGAASALALATAIKQLSSRRAITPSERSR